MKKNEKSKDFTINFYEKKKLKILLIFLIFIETIKSEIPNFKAIYLSGNYYFVVNATNIFYYSTELGKINSYTFDEDQKINNQNEYEMISFGVFRNDNVANLLIVKHYVYAMFQNDVFCQGVLNEIRYYSSQVYPLECINGFCYYIVCFENSSKNLIFHLYSNKVPTCESNSVNNININIDSNSFSCQLMKSPYDDNILTCFYQSSNKIVSSTFKTYLDNDNKRIEELTSWTASKEIDGAKIIKSTLSQDRTKSFVCYINNDNNCECLIYDITNNVWSDNNIYLNDCLLESSSLHIEYFENKSEYILYCFQSAIKFDLQKFDTNFGIKEDEENGIYDLTHLLTDCPDYYLSSLVHNSEDINMFVSCNHHILKYETENAKVIIQTTIISTIITTLPVTTIITTLPATTILTALPATTILTTLPATTILQLYLKQLF